MPRLFILCGCNGSGKTTASYTMLPEILDCREFVNSDEFAKSLSPFDPSTASVTASRYMLKRIEFLLDKGMDFSIETTLATRSLVSIIGDAKERGYTISIVYLWVQSPEIAIKRVQDRVNQGGHNIREDVLRRRYRTGIKYLFDTYMPLSDRWLIIDNTSNPFSVVAEGSSGRLVIIDEDKFNKIRNIALDEEQS